MTFLYGLSNIIIPTCLLLYNTLVLKSKNQNISYTKWALLFIFIFVFNLLTIFNSSIITIIDLVLKIAIIYLPNSLQNKVTQKIHNMHLESILQSFRNNIINKIMYFHNQSLLYLLKKLRPQQNIQIRQKLINFLRQGTTIRQTPKKILPEEIINKIQPVVTNFNNYSSPNNSKVYQPVKKQFIQQRYAELPKQNMKRSVPVSRNPNQRAIKQVRQSHFLQEDIHQNKNKNLKMTSSLKISQVKKKQTKNQILKAQRQNSSDNNTIREQAQILDKLNLSSSQYSDMFESDQQDLQNNKLLCKVEAIVQTGHPPATILQIMNVQLYANKQIAILSLYDKQIQRHKLKRLKKAENNYYLLEVQGNPRNRKIKFRGQYQAFQPYIN